MTPKIHMPLFIIWFVYIISLAYCLPYDVYWLNSGTIINRDTPNLKQSLSIYCYAGSDKNILALWQSVKFNIKIKNNEFSQYVASTPEEVYKDYTEDSYGWSVVNPFQTKASKTVAVDLFNTTCMAINTKERHSVELQVNRADIWRVLLMFTGVTLIFASRALSGNPVFFYLCGIFIGVFASFMVFMYYISKLLPKRTLTYGILIGGWTVGVYIFQQIWENMRSIILSYQSYMFWYTLIVSFVSFLVCYRIGPPKNQRSKNIVMWTLQGVGVLMTFFSSDYQEASSAVIIACFCIKYFPQALLLKIGSYWRSKFPAKRRLLSSEEYYEEGARETKMALENLRKYCSSPDCAQWRVMLKLNDSKRFASFVEGESHLSDDEILDYESYAFSMERDRDTSVGRGRQGKRMLRSSRAEISDDDSSDSEVDL